MSEKDNLSADAVESASAPEPAGEESTAQGSELHAQLEDARGKADEHWNQCLRLQAELENLRKRNQRELENAHKYALEKFAVELLPVRDSLEMGLNAAQGEEIDPAKLLEGTDLTLKMLVSVMEKFNIHIVDPAGERFNPDLHQAMAMQEAADAEPNTVLTVVQKGFLLNDRLIRPALVVVAKAASKPDGDNEPGSRIDEQA